MEAVAGGTQHHLLDLAFGLDPERFEQYLVISLQRNPGFAEQIPDLEAHGVGVVELPMYRRISPWRDWRALRRLVDIVTRLQPDLIHGHSAKGGFLARMAAARRNIPAIYTPHILPFRKYRSSLKRYIYCALERYAARRTDFLIAVSDSERRAALDANLLPADRVPVIPNGIVASDYYYPQRREAVRQELGVDEATVLVGAVGDLRPQKDYDTLVNAAALFAPSALVQFVVAGEGWLRDQLTALIERLGVGDRVTLLGWHEDIAGLLAALDVFVMPSSYEGCPYALLQAMAAGTPIVASATADIADIIVDGTSGRLAPVGDAQALSETIKQVLADRQSSRQMANRAQQLVRQEYKLESMIARTAQLYERCWAER